MSWLWFRTPLLWKALRFIVLFNYEIFSSVIHCDWVTDSTWLRRDCPDWITGRTEQAEPHACETRHSTSSLWRVPRTHPGGTGAPSTSSAPCCQEQLVPPPWPPQRWPPLWPFPSLRCRNLLWYLLLRLAQPGDVVRLHWAKSSINTVQTQHQHCEPVVALDMHTPSTGLQQLPTNEGAAQGVQWPPWHQEWAGSHDSSTTDPRAASWLQREKGVMCQAGIPKLWVVSFNLGKHLIQCVTTHHIYLILSSFGYDYCHMEWKLSDAPWAKKYWKMV